MWTASKFDLRSRDYWRQLGWGLFTGLASAMGAFVFIAVMDFGQGLVWSGQTDWMPFTGSWLTVVIMTVAGLLVGIIHHFSDAEQPDVFDAVDEGHLDPKPVPASLLASLISLIGGFSLGPEVPTGMLSAGLGSWIAERRRLDADIKRTNVIGGVSAAYAGLFSSPFVVLLLLLESAHLQTVAYYGTLLIAGLAASVGFGLFYYGGGDAFSSLLGILSLPTYDLYLWHLGAGMLLGLLAVPIGLLFPVVMLVLRKIVAPLDGRPIVRGVVGGVLLGLLGYVLPITLGLGTDEMVIVSQQAAEIGIALLIIFALGKILALGGALAFGFIGGPIFPLLFVGTTVGSIVSLIFPQLPPALAVSCIIVAVPATVVPIPLTLAAIGIVIIGVNPTNALPVFLAALIAFSIPRGLGIGSKQQAQEEA